MLDSFRALAPDVRAARAIPLAVLYLVTFIPVAHAAEGFANPLTTVSVAEQRVRASDSHLRGMLELAAARSQTVRELITVLQDSNVIVHICPRVHDGDIVSGTLQYVGTYGGQRYLRIRVRLDLVQPQLIALIGHELRHAVEVASDVSVVDATSMERLYRRIGFARGSHRHETVDAQETEDRILRELAVVARAE
jgi:hypothetical protein